MIASAVEKASIGDRWIYNIKFGGCRCGCSDILQLNVLRLFTRFAKTMRDYTPKEKAGIAAGAVAALVIVAWLAIITLALLSSG